MEYADDELSRMLIGDEQEQATACHFLYDVYRPDFLRFLTKKGATYEVVQDGFQEAMVAAIQYLESGREIEHLRGYLWVVTSRHVFREMKKRGKSVVISDSDWENLHTQPSTENQHMSEQLLDLLKPHMERMNSDCWAVFELRHRLDLTWREVGQCLGISNSAAMMRYGRCRRAVTAFLQQSSELQQWLKDNQPKSNT